MNQCNSIVAFNLPEVQMHAGDHQSWAYQLYDSSSSASALLDLNASTASVKLFRYGDTSTTIVELPGVIDNSQLGTIVVDFPGASSINLSGTYIQQPTIIDYQGKKHIPAQGKVVVFGSPYSVSSPTIFSLIFTIKTNSMYVPQL